MLSGVLIFVIHRYYIKCVLSVTCRGVAGFGDSQINSKTILNKRKTICKSDSDDGLGGQGEAGALAALVLAGCLLGAGHGRWVVVRNFRKNS